MKIKFTKKFEAKLARYKKFDPKLLNRIIKQLEFFANNPQHPSLRKHKIRTADNIEAYSLSINMSIRALYQLEGDMAHFYNIGTHDEVYG